jgi:predicted nucleic acid-binding Zn ribbon protein
MHIRKCRGCGDSFELTRQDRVWCSSHCYHRHRRVDRDSRDAVQCGHCKCAFLPYKMDQRYCSAKCRSAFNHQRQKDDGRYAAQLAKRRESRGTNPAEPGTRRLGYVSSCVVCGAQYAHNHKRRRYCSTRCGAKASYENRKRTPEYKAARLGCDQRRRARKRTGTVEVFSSAEIFDRDRNRCHICRRKCRRDVVVPHPLAPTLDHLIPLAEGGEHTRANTATACFLCNSVKGDRGGGEQLAIV